MLAMIITVNNRACKVVHCMERSTVIYSASLHLSSIYSVPIFSAIRNVAINVVDTLCVLMEKIPKILIAGSKYS